jgi:hypothetical protein
VIGVATRVLTVGTTPSGNPVYGVSRSAHRIGARMRRLVLACLAVTLAPAAMASQQGIAADIKWKQMDRCAKLAQTAFPDFTAASNAKRDAKVKECLEGGNLPPREPLSPAH